MGIAANSNTDAERVGYSLANVGELLFGCLEAAKADSVLEIGAFRGDLTRVLLEWAGRGGARIVAVDPTPEPELLELEAASPELELVREPSHEALRSVQMPDAVILDGDHNHFTLSEELRLLAQRAPGAELPLLIFHDVGWPHARRDSYYAPERIPAEHRQPLARDAFLAPDEPGIASGGLPFPCVAAREGGPRNGVLTAVEEFVSDHDGLAFARVPAFFGLGLVWHREAPWAGAVADVVAAFDAHPMLERLESNRVFNLARRYALQRELDRHRRENAEFRRLLNAMLGSRAFALAEQVSRLNQRDEPVFSREQVRRALGE